MPSRCTRKEGVAKQQLVHVLETQAGPPVSLFQRLQGQMQGMYTSLKALTLNARIANHQSRSRLGQKYDVSQASGSSLCTSEAQYAALSCGPPAVVGTLSAAPGVRWGRALGVCAAAEEWT